MVGVLMVMAACAAGGYGVAASLALYAQRHWRRPPEDPPGGDTQDRYGLVG